MKTLFVLSMLLLTLMSCENYVTKRIGGNMEIKLPPNECLINATWKDDQLWYLTEPMKNDYQPTVKIFREKSMVGVLEGSVKFIETKE